MADARRTTGPIEPSDPTRRVLAALREQEQAPLRPELLLQNLADVEMAFAARFSDDLLAVWAAAVPWLSDTHKLTVTGVIGLTGALREHRVRGDLIGVGRWGDLFLCVEKRQRVPAPGCELVILDPDDKTSETVALASWLSQRLEERGSASPRDVSAFAPRIVRPLPAASSGKKVRHAKFGEGNVLREIGTGPLRKLQIDFPTFGLKMLQARFVEYLD